MNKDNTNAFLKAHEVANFLMVKPHVISYWEAEFNEVKPQRNKDGQKIYSKDDVEILSAIKHLLYEKKFTVAGARKVLRESTSISQIINPKEEECFNALDQKISQDNFDYENRIKKLMDLKESLLLVLNTVNKVDKSSSFSQLEAIKR